MAKSIERVLDLDLAREVAPYFRLSTAQAETVLRQVVAAEQQWPSVATRYQLPWAEQELLASAFELTL
jgi:serine/threonine-protein kinase HipA